MRSAPLAFALLAAQLPAQFATPAPAAQAAREPLTGNVVDPDGKPVAGAMVELWRADGKDMNGLDLDYSRSYRLLARVPTSKSGAFGMQLPRGLRCQLRIDQPPYARWICDAIDAGEVMRVELARPATFTGKVVLTDGTGTPARLQAWNDESTYILDDRTDALGNFRCERLPAGGVTIKVAPDAASSPAWQKSSFVAGETVELTFTCQPGLPLRGRVVDAATGKPIAGASVGEGWTLHRAVVTAADGTYELRGFGSEGYGDVHCTADGYVREMMLPKDIPAEAPRNLEFRLDRGNAAKGALVAPDGTPVADAYVAALGTVHDGEDQYHYWVSGRTDVAGKFHLQGIRPDIPPTLLIRKDGWATLVFHLAAAKNAVHDAGRIDMRKPRLVTGRVLGLDGKPEARISVGLWGSNSDRSRMATMPAQEGRLGGWALLRMYVDLHSARTDSDGRFAFGDIPAGDYKLTVYGPNNEKLVTGVGVVVKADADPESVVIDLSK